jgi:hypothetical protein|tara:strand:- start:384 stop:572 length:189 start_codon:yes stop_codon:yes gene_type:complete
MSKEFKESLQLGKFTINKPKEWALDEVELEINDYDYVSTNITINDLRMLGSYIESILNQTDE